jgi:multidrug resistance efflux pump
MVMKSIRKILLWGGVVAVVIGSGVAISAYVLARSPARNLKGVESPERSDERAAKEGEMHVKAINPRRDPSLVISVQQLLEVEPFIVADLRAQVAGEVRDVQKAIDDPVKKGELLVDIKVPDLEQELREREAVIEQRRQELAVAKAQAENAAAQVEVSREVIEQRRAEYGQAVATRELNEIKDKRYQGLRKTDTIQQMMVDEVHKEYLASEYAVYGSAASVRKAEADLREKESAQRIAEADIELKRRLVDVARKNRDRAQAMLNYSQIVAPFDGVVVKRNVDVGTFVQNSSTGQSPALLTIARNDIVTVVMKVPDNAAPYVSNDTEAIIQIDELPGVMIRGKVTRYSPWIQNKDRTMRVEVDLYNDTPEKYKRFCAHAMAARLAGTAADSPFSLASLLSATRAVCSTDSKSSHDSLPQMPVVSGPTEAPRLIPGMSGYMRLNLASFHDAYLIPNSAVFTRGGKPYIMEVTDGVTRLLPVRVHVSDGRLANVSVIVQPASATKGTGEILRDLTGNEVILLNRQTEVGEGQSVKVTMQKW